MRAVDGKVLALTGFLALAAASGFASPTDSAGATQKKPGFRIYSGYFLNDGVRIAAAPAWWKGKDWLRLGILGAGTGALVWQDENIRDVFQRNRTKTTNRLADGFNFLAGSGAFPILVGTLAAGVVFKDEKLKATAIDGGESALFALSWCEFIKIAASRARPFKNEGVWKREGFSTDASFPSGHTTLAFALATTASCEYDKTWVTVASYALATGVGLARLNDDRHFASDVLVGAALGTAVARTIFKRNEARRHPKPAPTVRGQHSP